MAETWQTIEQAAVSLRLSVRTINRHIAAGKLQSRLSDGRREVLVTDMAPPAEPADEPSATPAGPSGVDAEAVLALADNAAEKAELAVSAYQALARVADTQVRSVRRGARIAWASVAVMAVGVTVAVGWATHRITRASAEVHRLNSQLIETADEARELSARNEALTAERVASEDALRRELSATRDALQAERASAEAALRGEVAAARDQAARAEGALAAYREIEAQRQTSDKQADARRTVESASSDTSPEASSSDASTDSAVLAKSAEPTTKPSVPRRKVRAPATRPAAPSDTSSASTDD